ncbi:MAG: hypothetical protein UY13_C0002G0391 [Candidatus Pacebacteria bacterium GW2011_GWB1_47_8]|nr:MAG: hypothetical protein UX28_C0001G0538 [Candidatus Pacebacteria bacterium GW2011_GWA1_46_10]KKU84479.1 MAG: hypothetical protein UY13_C0002G0391 [Candidatus Pacebacteria bacterium GW2011_GWB1_47_8]HCR81089.1 hypothetical protein [Candidatus Paceibacterota bacterium]
MDRTYKNLVFTKHALERTSGRVLTQDAIYQTVTAPDKTFLSHGNTKFIRTVNNRLIHVVATPIENHQWLVVSAWVRGEEDRESLVWQLLSLPFKLTWRGLLVIWKYFKKRI